MNIKEIIKTYLGQLQVLQATVANTWCGKRRFQMHIIIGMDCVNVLIFELDELNREIDSVQCFLGDGWSKEDCDSKVIALHAWFGEKCMTSVTGVDCQINPN